MINELLKRRGLLMSSGSAIDWEAAARAFCGDTTPTTLVIPEGITKLRNYAFTRMSMTKVILPSTLIEPVGTYCFDSCTNLSEVVLGDGITTLTTRMFSGCTMLKSLTIPSQVTLIYDYAFTSLDELICEPTTPFTASANALRYVSVAIYVPDASVSAYKSANVWSNYASIIKPISQRPT